MLDDILAGEAVKRATRRSADDIVSAANSGDLGALDLLQRQRKLEEDHARLRDPAVIGRP